VVPEDLLDVEPCESLGRLEGALHLVRERRTGTGEAVLVGRQGVAREHQRRLREVHRQVAPRCGPA
jgi:hypothetical protein